MRESLNTPQSANADTEIPVPREFGSPGAKSAASSQGRKWTHKRSLLAGSVGLLMAGGATYAIHQNMGEKAPAFNLSASLSGAAATAPAPAAAVSDALASAPAIDLSALEPSAWPQPVAVPEALDQIRLLKEKLLQAEARVEQSSLGPVLFFRQF